MGELELSEFGGELKLSDELKLWQLGEQRPNKGCTCQLNRVGA